MTAKMIDLGIVLVLLLGVVWFRSVRTARLGNLTAALALGCAVVVVLLRHPVSPVAFLVAFALLGTVAGGSLARRISMVGIPAMVALQNGLGGLASFVVSFVELARGANLAGSSNEIAALLGIIVGAATFSGSLVAAGRLSRWLAQRPTVFRHHSLMLAGLAALALLLMVLALPSSHPLTQQVIGLALIVVAGALGVVLSIRVGGADMPVLISFLNAGSGVAAAFCGLSIGNWLLIAAGAMVGVSGMILTQVMCQAMNRRLANILAGGAALGQLAESLPPADPPSPAGQEAITEAAPKAGQEPVTEAAATAQSVDPFTRALDLVRSAQRIIIVPGYGMALAEAQEEVSRLADKLSGMGRDVTFAIHPVAGRMPGHMHVLLAEAEVDYGMIRELQDVNPQFAVTDLALIVGACDVVNPAATQRKDTPISGMPILQAHEAKSVIVCNLDDRPGYSGVENPLYQDPKTVLLLGDAKETVGRLLEQLG